MKKFVLLICSVLFFPCLLWAQLKGTEVTLRTQDGWNLAAVYLPAAQEDNKTVVLLHDIGDSHKRFETFANKLASKGIGYLALDLRGHGRSVNLGSYKSFAKEGVDNEYNKMTRDVNAAVEFLKGKDIPEENIFFVGAGMGANVAAKAISLWPQVGGLALLTPVTNYRDVLPIPALRVYKGKVFIAAAADDKKTFLEASVMRNVAFLSSGEGNVTFATAYDKKGHELLDAWVSPELLQWLQTPQKPEQMPDLTDLPQETFEQTTSTEEGLFPSVLN